jgi:hypothetical protein
MHVRLMEKRQHLFSSLRFRLKLGASVQLALAARLFYSTPKPAEPIQPAQSPSRSPRKHSKRPQEGHRGEGPIITPHHAEAHFTPGRHNLSYGDSGEAEGYRFASTALHSDPQGQLETFLSFAAHARSRPARDSSRRRAHSAGEPLYGQ